MTTGMLSTYRPLYLTFFDLKNGRMKARFDTVAPTGAGAMVAMLSRGKLTRDSSSVEFEIVTDPTQDASARGLPGKDGASATTLLGEITISERAVVAINAGTRRITVTTPVAWGVAKGQDFLICADALPNNSYALHDAIATGPNTLSIGITTPALALLSSYSITARVRRLN